MYMLLSFRLDNTQINQYNQRYSLTSKLDMVELGNVQIQRIDRENENHIESRFYDHLLVYVEISNHLQSLLRIMCGIDVEKK